MTVLSYAAEEEVETSGLLDGLLIGRTLGIEVLCVSVEDMDVLLRFASTSFTLYFQPL